MAWRTLFAHRHCERSEAIQTLSAVAVWIASLRSQLCMFTNSLIGSLRWRTDPMRDNSYDRTIERNYLQKWRFLI
uniref:hypothetical protein n=1 Tax=Bradyrhizobium sp. WSM2254 TaxID=1188263 RepID=UPI001AEBD1BF